MRLAVIAGDGIGPEVVAEGLKVLREVAPDVEPTHYDLGADSVSSDHCQAHGDRP